MAVENKRYKKYNLQVDLAEVRYMMKIATQRLDTSAFIVTSYYVKVSDDADGDFTAVCSFNSCPQLFTVSDDRSNPNAVTTSDFDWPIAARFVRLNPQSWISAIGLGCELYGCDSLV